MLVVLLLIAVVVELARAEHGVDGAPLVVALLHGHGAVKGGERAAAAPGARFDAPDVAREGGVRRVLGERDVFGDHMALSALLELVPDVFHAMGGTPYQHLGHRASRGALAATGLWQARSTARHWDMLHHMVVPWMRW